MRIFKRKTQEKLIFIGDLPEAIRGRILYMKSLSKLFRIGSGPSSSHTIAPSNAALFFKEELKAHGCEAARVTLYGSLALTGKGHGTDKAIQDHLQPYPCEILIDLKTSPEHPNEMKFSGLSKGVIVFEITFYSLGGGEIYSPDYPGVNEKDIYPFRSFDDVKEYINNKGYKSLKNFCLDFEDASIDSYLSNVLETMFCSVEKGLKTKGKIPANANPRLQLFRSAGDIYSKACQIDDKEQRRALLITSYAYAVAESSACMDEIVTAPTCGSSGILPAILYYEYKDQGISKEILKDSLYTAGIIGNVIKQNASIAGAIGGCQAEVGTATSMAAAALCFIDGLSLFQIEYAAECAMEHMLGLSCDPVDGYVIIPCIERNGMGALRAYDAYLYAKFISPVHKNQVSFDNVVAAMKLTGDSLASAYKETAEGGLAEILNSKER